MTQVLSDDLPKRMIEAVESGMSRRAAAERFNIGFELGQAAAPLE